MLESANRYIILAWLINHPEVRSGSFANFLSRRVFDHGTMKGWRYPADARGNGGQRERVIDCPLVHAK